MRRRPAIPAERKARIAAYHDWDHAVGKVTMRSLAKSSSKDVSLRTLPKPHASAVPWPSMLTKSLSPLCCLHPNTSFWLSGEFKSFVRRPNPWFPKQS